MLSGTPSITEISLAVIAAATLISVIALVPLLIQARRTAARAERILSSVDGSLPGLLTDLSALIRKLDRTADTVQDIAASMERLGRFAESAAETVEGVRDTARQMTQDVIMPSVARAVGVLSALREGMQWVRPRHDKGRDER